MITLADLKREILADPGHAMVHLMDFVDDFRHHKDLGAVAEHPQLPEERLNALVAATVETLCGELALEPPAWIEKVPACRDPWFVSGMEDLKAIALVESPLPFRLRKVFVLENFLVRV